MVHTEDNRTKKGGFLQNNCSNNKPTNKGGDSVTRRSAATASLVKRTAELMGVTEQLVYKVLRGYRTNEQVMACYITLLEGETQLLDAVKKLVPFNLN